MGLTSKVATAVKSAMLEYPPILGFYFRAGLAEQMAASSVDSQFQEVSGLSMSLEYEEVKEGGNNEYVHRLPTHTKYENLVLKRGLISMDSDLAQWCTETIAGGLNAKIETQDLYVELMAPDTLEPLVFWRLEGAYPVKWDVTSLNAQESAIVIESMEFAFRTMSVTRTG